MTIVGSFQEKRRLKINSELENPKIFLNLLTTNTEIGFLFTLETAKLKYFGVLAIIYCGIPNNGANSD